jgi:mono/diheme cytochrome c family protein
MIASRNRLHDLFVLGATLGFAAIILLRWCPAIYPKESRERGRYLVEAVTICFECHSERDYKRPGWPIQVGMAGGGRILWGEGSTEQLVAPNITPDKDTGIGGWKDEDIVHAISDGVGPGGRQLNPEMPYRYFRTLSERDLRSIVSYLRSIPSVSHQLPKNPPFVGLVHPPAMDSLKLTNHDWKARRGEFLVRLAACETCHTPSRAGEFIFELAFGGGTEFHHGSETSASSNLTSDASGIAYYDQKQFVDVMRNGKVGGRPLMSAMPWYFYRNMTTQDLESIFAYLQTVPHVQHRVDNTEPPSLCRLCGNRHGMGEHN